MKKIVVAFVLFITAMSTALAATSAPVFLFTWKASSYVSPRYTGRIIPGLHSTVTAAIELIDNGKIADISKKEIRWFLGNKLVQSGIGQRTFQFQTNELGFDGAAIHGKAVVVNYGNGDAQRLFTIPVAKPEVVIRAPDTAMTSGRHLFESLLYYWNVADPLALHITWAANGVRTNGDGDARVIELSLPPVSTPTPLMLTAAANNPANEFEFANTAIGLSLQPMNK